MRFVSQSFQSVDERTTVQSEPEPSTSPLYTITTPVRLETPTSVVDKGRGRPPPFYSCRPFVPVVGEGLRRGDGRLHSCLKVSTLGRSSHIT